MSMTLRKLNLILYKNFLVRKRQGYSAIAQLIIPLILMKFLMDELRYSKPSHDWHPQNRTFEPEEESKFILLNKMSHFYIVPDNAFTEAFASEIKSCLQTDDRFITRFKTENDMIKAYKNHTGFSAYKGIVFDNDVDISSKQTKYKIFSHDDFPPLPFGNSHQYQSYTFDSTIGVQICTDKAIIKMKNSLEKDNLQFYMEKMVEPSKAQEEVEDTMAKYFEYIFAILAAIAFYVELCIETPKASEEKFLGVNVLMAMNGVPNYLNLLGWLLSGLIFSLTYTVPLTILLNFGMHKHQIGFLANGNSFIFWLILTVHAAHLFSFGMHVLAYFTRPKFLFTGLLILYGGSASLAELHIKDHPIIPYLGIIFPNILLMRACKEIVYYQNSSGISFSNLFKVDRSVYGVAGSLGMIIIFSIFGSILHFILANYICAINPGKYGVKKHPLYFLEYLRKPDNSNSYDKVDNFEFNNTNGQPFESVPDGALTPGIQLRNLRKTYTMGLFRDTHVNALKGINVDFYQGQITSLLGHNGAGKTTMMSILTGMTSPTEGLVLINGKNVRDSLDEIMNDIGLCPQENIVFPNLSISEQLRFFSMIKNTNKSSAMIKDNVNSLLKELNLYDKRDVLPKNLSGGQKRRICLGMALVGDSSIWILDEPTSGLDPEIRRSVWDILLKKRGQKTILISTHDMEEADILGDRIAIVHSGRLRSYGTNMFLKKLLGRGNVEVTLSVESWCTPESIRTYLGQQSEILNTDGSKIVMSIPNTPDLPDALDRIESHKKNLGITGMSVSLITLEQVFLKVTKENEDETDSQEPLISASHKLSGLQQALHASKGLLLKKAVYTWKNITTFLMMLFLIISGILLLGSVLSISYNIPVFEPINIRLDTYEHAKTYYRHDVDPHSFGNNYVTTVKEFSGEAIRVKGNMTQELLDYGFQNYDDYKTCVIAGADFRTTNDMVKVQAYYNDIIASHAKPISMNLVSNAILKAYKGLSYSIDMSVQTFPIVMTPEMSAAMKEGLLTMKIYFVPILLMFFIFPAVAHFSTHPFEETETNIKHLQRMTGLSAVNYWGSMFLLDFAVMLIFLIILIFSFFVIDQMNNLNLMEMNEILILSALFLLFSTSALPFIYCHTFWKKNKSDAMRLLYLLPFCLMIIEGIMIFMFESFPDSNIQMIRPIQKKIFLLTPYIGFFHASIPFFKTSLSNAFCRQMSTEYDPSIMDRYFRTCQNMNCNNGKCENPLPFFNNFKDDMSLEAGLLSLSISTILYFLLLWIHENKLISIVIARLKAEEPESDQDSEEQVKKVKRSIENEIGSIETNSTNTRNVESLESVIQNRHVFLVYELRRKYGDLVAVKDITFGVNQSECFGLLGVNGAGKSTTFRMMTGEEVPHNGVMYLNEKKLNAFRESNYSQMGYCPQSNALIRSLNAYEHLRLFARLRGIPEPEVNNEVHKWIKRLNLNACASQRSDTYSGGNMRRLNIAMSMIGLPDVVLMDEPTTGVDPAARRALWNVIKSSQRTSGQAVILTSHSMEECEALCSRLAIMVGGRLVCIGPSEELKQRFGAGYDIQIKLNPEKAMLDIEGIKREIEASLQCELIDENIGYLMFHVSSPTTKWRKMYDVMNAIKKKYTSVEDFSVLSSTLEQLFLLFARGKNK